MRILQSGCSRIHIAAKLVNSTFLHLITCLGIRQRRPTLRQSRLCFLQRDNKLPVVQLSQQVAFIHPMIVPNHRVNHHRTDAGADVCNVCLHVSIVGGLKVAPIKQPIKKP